MKGDTTDKREPFPLLTSCTSALHVLILCSAALHLLAPAQPDTGGVPCVEAADLLLLLLCNISSTRAFVSRLIDLGCFFYNIRDYLCCSLQVLPFTLYFIIRTIYSLKVHQNFSF